MTAELLHARSHGDVANVVFFATDEIHVLVDGSADELRGVIFRFAFTVVLILEAVLGFGKVTDELCDEPLLFDGGILMLPRLIAFLNTLARSNIFYEMLSVLRRTRFDIPPLQNHSCHRYYPF